MNVIKVYGGLGNQLFQYAFGQAQEANGIDVCYDISWFDRSQHADRPYRLDKFCIDVQKGYLIKRQRTINEVSLNYLNDLLLLKLENCNFLGYWQHPRYFQKIFPQLEKEFCVRSNLYTEEFLDWKDRIEKSESVSVHVRRGDYVTIPNHYLLPMDYYNRALEQFRGKEIFVFSDDIDWCQRVFENANFVCLKEDYLEFELMKLCQHNIIANSTFSWWAAVLNDNPDKIVVSPKKWRPTKEGQSVVDKELISPKGCINL